MKEESGSKLIAIGITVTISGLLTYWAIHGVGAYGIALFILTPLFIGVCPVVIYGRKRTVNTTQAMSLGFLSLAIFVIGLVVFALEGLICIAMAAPLGILLTWGGTVIGQRIIRSVPGGGTPTVIILILIIPVVAFRERYDHHVRDLIAVTTSIEINAKPEDVWKKVVEFPALSTPTEFIFKTGIAYPIDATIEGRGPGAVRHCNFSTGSFVEPITIWDEPSLLKFDVVQNPAPMKEVSFYELDAPHLHDYFVSKQGQFKLTVLANGKTQLEGTTWYEHDIHPAFYWRLWSEYIVHKIHLRVLTHIKDTTERQE